MKKLLFTLIFAIAGTSAFALPIKVGDDTIDPYASIRAVTVFNHTDGGDFAIANRSVGTSFSQMAIALQSNSRAGIRWTRGQLFLHNEWSMGGDATTPALNLRLLYGDYRFAGGGRIRVGQIPGIAHTFSFYDTKLSWDNGMQGFGTMQESRRAGINYEHGGFSVSAISMRQDSAAVTGVFGSGFSNVTFQEIMPRFEVAYAIPNLRIAGSYVKSSVMANATVGEVTTNDQSFSVGAGHIMIYSNPTIANNTRLIMSAFYSVNAGLYQMVSIGSGFHNHEAVNRNGWFAAPHVKEAGKGDVYNTSAAGGAVALRANAFEIGFGIQS